MQITKRIIIGLTLCFGLIVQTANVHAIYSPTISKRVSIIKQHVRTAREHNGSGSITAAIKSVKAQDDERAKEGKSRALPVEATLAIPRVLGDMFTDLIKAPLDPIYMIFNIIPSTGAVVSTCLRNDIWILEDLRDVVVQEMIKAYLMMDSNNGDLLSNDYEYLRYYIGYLKEYGHRPQYPKPNPGDTIPITSSERLFGSKSSINYYSITFPTGEGCPESDFVEAFDEVKQSLITLKTLSSGSGSDWGSILVMAKANARRRAEEWIKANQITLTLGGEAGGNPQSLIKGDSWNVFVGQFKTQKQILKNMIGPLTPLFSWGIYSRGEEPDEEISYGCMYYYADAGVFRACTVEQLKDYKICQSDDPDDKEEQSKIDCDKFRNPTQVITPVETVENYQAQASRHQKSITSTERSLKYNTTLNNMSEQGLIEMDRVMWEINKEIGRSFEADGDEAGKGLPYLYSQLKTFIQNHCGGKNCP